MSTPAERHWSTKSPEGPWDYIVIGSGMGGMATAATLSQAGFRVLVLEQHYTAGGFTHAFRRKKWAWDVGVHAIGEVERRTQLGRVLHRLTNGKLEWTTLGPVYDAFHFPDLRIDFPNRRDTFADNLKAAFPDRGAEIDAYLRRVKDVSRAMGPYFLTRLVPGSWGSLAERVIARDARRFLETTTQSELDRITTDKRLQTVLTAQWGYYGVTPDRSSFAIHALTANHFFWGGYYPVGGAGKIAENLLGTVAANGGWTRIRAIVDEIVIEKNRATGVRLEGGEIIHAKRGIVSAAGALATVRKLLPESERAKSWATSIGALQPSPAHVCLYLGFKGDIRAAGASASNQWFYEKWSHDVPYWDVNRGDPEAPVLYCSFPSLKDPTHDPGPEQLHTGEVVTFVPYDAFAKWKDGRWHHRGEDYEALKARLEGQIRTQFLKHMPALAPHIAFAELSTPVTTEHFTRATSGAIYGIEPTPERFRTASLKPRTPVKNLYLSGSDVGTAGVMGAFVGGLLSAAAAEPLKAGDVLRRALTDRGE